MIDLNKVTPAPWRTDNGARGEVNHGILDGVWRSVCCCFESQHDAEFIAIARNAFACMMEFGWSVERIFDGPWAGSFKVTIPAGITDCEEWDAWCRETCNRFPDPFTALSTAYLWKKARKL